MTGPLNLHTRPSSHFPSVTALIRGATYRPTRPSAYGHFVCSLPLWGGHTSLNNPRPRQEKPMTTLERDITEDAANACDDLADLASAARDLAARAEALHMRQTMKDLNRLARQSSVALHRVEAGTMSAKHAWSWIETTADALADHACRIGDVNHGR